MKKILIFVLTAFFVSFATCVFAQSAELKIHFLDVKEGDSILIQAPSGKTALIDAGNLISGFRVIKYLKKQNIRSLDYLILTHPHPDHIGGAFFVIPMLGVKFIYDNGQDLTGLAESNDLYRWYVELARGAKNYKALKAEDRLLLGEVVLSALWPPQPPAFSDFNANSLVLMLEYGEFRCLLAGDLTVPGEGKLLKQGADLKADVLKVGHHGADDASCEEFLRSVSPKIAIISADKENNRRYPSQEVIEKLQKIGAKIYLTDEDGDIVLRIFQNKKSETEIKVEKGR